MMITLPLAILAFFIFRDPDYLQNLMNSTWASRLTILAIILQIIGSLWVMRVLASSKQS